MTAFFSHGSGDGRSCFQQVAVFSAAQLNQITIFGLGIMPYISASIIFQLLGSVWGPLEQLAKRRRKRPQENQRIHALRHRACLCIGQSWAYLGFLVQQRPGAAIRSWSSGSLSFGWQLVTVHDDDRRHDLPDVAGRADRRVRHRQRHQLDHHGRHSGRHAGRRVSVAATSRASSWAAARASSAWKC